MNRPCKNCPFKRCNEWVGGVNWKMIALDKIEQQQIFSCHMTNEINVASREPMVNDDCVGFKMMKENMVQKNKHPKIVNHFNETTPEYDITYIWEDWWNTKFLLPLTK